MNARFALRRCRCVDPLLAGKVTMKGRKVWAEQKNRIQKAKVGNTCSQLPICFENYYPAG